MRKTCGTLLSILILIGIVVMVMPSSRKLAQSKLPDGSYEIVSDMLFILKPKKMNITRSAPDWAGLLFMNDGHYSQTQMNKKRDVNWFSSFPRNLDSMGYLSESGTFRMEGDGIRFNAQLSLHPFYVNRERLVEVRQAEGGSFLLVEKLRPYRETASEGERIIKIRKLDRP